LSSSPSFKKKIFHKCFIKKLANAHLLSLQLYVTMVPSNGENSRTRFYDLFKTPIIIRLPIDSTKMPYHLPVIHKFGIISQTHKRELQHRLLQRRLELEEEAKAKQESAEKYYVTNEKILSVHPLTID
jgi:hypothetical protein